MPISPNDEVKEMNDVFNDIISKTDEEIKQQELDDANKSDGSGETTKDQVFEADQEPVKEDKITTPDPKPDTEPVVDVSVLQAKVEQLESELKKEHQRTSSWDGRIKAANNRVKELEIENESLKEKLAKAPVVPTEEEQSEQEIMDNFKATFPEFIEVLDIFQKKIDAKTSTQPTPAKVDSDNNYDNNSDNDSVKNDINVARAEHMNRIRKVHKEIDEMVQTGVILTWINSQPDFISSHLHNIYTTGNSDQINQMVSEFLKKTGWKSGLNTGDKVKQDKLKSMLEADSESPGPKTDGPDKNDYNQGAIDAGLV